MSDLKLFTITNPDILNVYPTLLALTESTKNDLVPFNPEIMLKILVSFQNHLESIAPMTMPAPDFENMIYTLAEQQKGFIISPSLREIIDTHRQKNKKNQLEIILEKMLIHNAKLE